MSITTPPPWAAFLDVLPIGETFVIRNVRSRAVVLANDAGLHILSALETGRAPADIAADVADRREDIAPLTAAISETLEAWQAAGLLSTEDLADRFPSWPGSSHPTFKADFVLGPRRVRIVSESAAVFGHLSTLMAEYRVFDAAAHADDEIHISETSEGLVVYSGGRPLWRAGTADEARFLALQAALASLAGPDIGAVVHGGCVVQSRTGLLLAGDTTRGKTTLTLALADAGWSFGGDDMIPLARDGAAAPLPLGAHIKRTVDLEARKEARRLHWVDVDGGLIWPETPCPPGARVAIATVLFPHFEPEATPIATPLTPEEALTALITTGTELTGTLASLAPLTELLNGAPAWRLTYPATKDALQLVEGIL